MESTFWSLAVVFTAVMLAPPLSQLSKRLLPVPMPVCEMVLGIIIGPEVLNLVRPDLNEAGDNLIHLMGRMGLAAIIFIAGYEFDYPNMKRKQVAWASGGWLISLTLAVAAGIGVAFAANAGGLDLQGDGGQTLIVSGAFIGIALTSTALSTAMPALRDANELGTPFGRAIVAAGTVGQLAPLLAISILFGGQAWYWAALALLGLGVLMTLALWVAQRGLPRCMRSLIKATMHSSGNFAVRLVVFVTAVLVALSAEVFGVHMLVGAFAAGALMRQLLNGIDVEDRELTERKFQGVAFGLLTPLFFISTGMSFELRELFAQPMALALIPVFILIMIFARGLPGSLVLPAHASLRDRFSAMLWTSVGLAVIVVVADVAVDQGALSPVMNSAMVGAGMISMLTFPTFALAIRRKTADPLPGS
ncbi:MAG: cation:proton antiporter [Promicromonosporaceae bacterium]|nr:cation:proton antiporter [Promicromonosporaceae bacterium]